MHTVMDQLAEAVSRAKSGSPLTQVTVIVPSHGSGRDVLHHLARTQGVANTSVLTLGQVVDKLAAPALAPRQPLPYPLLEAAVQRVLADAPGVFADVADEPITAQALASAAWELTGIAEPAMQLPTPLVADLLRIHRATTERLTSSYYLQHEAYSVAAERLDKLGALIIYHPAAHTPAEQALLRELQRRGETIDANTHVAPTQVIHSSDADDEIRAVVRLVRKHLASGVPGHRIGIFYGTEDPYLPLLHEHLTAGHIAFAGPECHTLVDRPTGRALLGLLALDHDTMPRRELFTLLAEGALRRPELDDTPITQPQLERLTRSDEPIVGGADWERLTRVGAHEKHHARAAAVYSYVRRLQADLRALVDAPDWATVAEHLNTLLDTYFRTPKRETAAADLAAIRADCAGIALMDGIAPQPTAARVLDAVSIRLNAHRGMHGTSGAGVTVAPIASGVGRDLDVCVVVGAAEGIVPAPRRDDPLLPPELIGITARDHMERQRLAFAGAVSAGRTERVVTFPRGNLRGGAEKVPSRWLLPALADLASRDVDVVNWQRATEDSPQIVAVESFDVAAQRADERIGASAASDTEWRLRELAAVPADSRRGALDDPIINRGMHMRSDRLNGRFTRFNGNLSSVSELITTFDQPVSPTGLELWVQSPYQYFLEHILRLRALDDPDEIAQIDALTRGTLIHTILERYVRETMDGAQLDLARLRIVAAEVLDEAQANSPGWLEQLWAKDRGTIMRDLDEWFTHDHADAADGWQPTHAEADFGLDAQGSHEVSLALGENRIRFRGQIDRIDRHHGGRIRVTDYKTGKADKYKDLAETTPTNSGLQFQLPVYGLFARTFGADVEARYWFITSKGKFASVGYPVTDDVVATLIDDMTLVHKSIRAGYFPPKIEDTHWDLPVIDLLGRAGLRRAWAALEHVDELSDYVQKYGG
ncbi:PD-(D/E)XK nuclease family protein [Gordonia rubripertincta]|uniref:PD-(D/E)XK nuclease family protein n=1 Tax=Gordonia rubripertincta TaxID=36822 RepID=UPI00117C09CC|nr:PD-(D/E)XK nuclease family protein [Gordonia rubripertincta]TSD96346.1 PD-(D/E)XK nuclease family protein [Gordonia rubripertincta]